MLSQSSHYFRKCSKQPKGPALALLNVLKRTGMEAVM